MKNIYLLLILIISVILLPAQQKGFPVKISRVIVDIPQGEPIIFQKNPKKEGEGIPVIYYLKSFRNANSFYPENIQHAFEKELNRRNFDVEGWGGLFPEIEEEAEPEISIGAIVKEVKIERNTMYTKLSVKSKINWKVLDLQTNQIVYDKILSSEYYTEQLMVEVSTAGEQFYNYASEIDSALFSSVGDLVLDEDFKKLTVKNNNNDIPLTDSSVVKIPKYKLAGSSQFLEKSIQGTVTIESPLGYSSGFFINNEGLILTCYHNFKKARPLTVYLNQGISIEAEVVKVNSEYDLALIKIKNVRTTALPLSESEPKVGQTVFTIGTPVNKTLNQSVFRGILSSTRTIESKRYLQSDASVSPGNSGGPMINDKGEVVGIVNAKVVSYGSEGIGFAIPIQAAMDELNISVD